MNADAWRARAARYRAWDFRCQAEAYRAEGNKDMADHCEAMAAKCVDEAMHYEAKEAA